VGPGEMAWGRSHMGYAGIFTFCNVGVANLFSVGVFHILPGASAWSDSAEASPVRPFREKTL